MAGSHKLATESRTSEAPTIKGINSAGVCEAPVLRLATILQHVPAGC